MAGEVGKVDIGMLCLDIDGTLMDAQKRFPEINCRALQACGDIRFPITICVISAWLTAFGGGVLLSGPLGLGLAGIWIAMACDECLRAGLFLWRWHTRTWSHIRLAAAYN